MKRILLATTVLALAFASCNNEPDFDGFNKDSKPANVAKYAITYSGGAFTAESPAKNTLPGWLNGKYYTCDKGSFATVDYKYVPSIPAYVSKGASTVSYTLKLADYQLAWGAGATINYYSPSKPAAKNIPAVLATNFASGVDGDLIAVTYNQADADGTQPAFKDDFEANKLEAAWKSVTTVGTYGWQVKSYSGNYYGQQSAYNHKAGALESYLISNRSIAVKAGMILAFDALYCNYKEEGGRISVLISTDLKSFSADDVKTAKWDDISDQFTYVTSPNNSGDITPVKDYAMDKYAGKDVYLAFKYTGNGEGNQTTTFRIDNVVIKDAKEVKVDSYEVAAVYQKADGAWKAYSDFVVPQAVDYKAMGVSALTSSTAQSYLPAFLGQKYPYAQVGNVKAVLYKVSATAFEAAEFQKVAAGWVSTSTEISLTDEYTYDGGNWVYVRTVPKAALNETFDGRTITSNDKTMLEGWLNVATKGTATWVDKTYNNNNYTQCSAYKAPGDVEVWLITPQLGVKSNYILKFDMVSGYWTHDALHVYISENFNGKEDGIATAKWTDITSKFSYPKNETGYSQFTPTGDFRLDSYVGKSVYVAFKYVGDKALTSTVQLDNIYVGE